MYFSSVPQRVGGFQIDRGGRGGMKDKDLKEPGVLRDLNIVQWCVIIRHGNGEKNKDHLEEFKLNTFFFFFFGPGI